MNQENFVKRYVAGFVFDPAGNRVILIKKVRPAWQKNLYNGVGGKIESGETPVQAMVRETQEEINLKTLSHNWVNFAELRGFNSPIVSENWSVEWFYIFTDKIADFKSNTDEIAEIFNVKNLPKTINNVPWLLALALSFKNDRAGKFIINEIKKQAEPVKSCKYVEAEQFNLSL